MSVVTFYSILCTLFVSVFSFVLTSCQKNKGSTTQSESGEMPVFAEKSQEKEFASKEEGLGLSNEQISKIKQIAASNNQELSDWVFTNSGMSAGASAILSLGKVPLDAYVNNKKLPETYTMSYTAFGPQIGFNVQKMWFWPFGKKTKEDFVNGFHSFGGTGSLVYWGGGQFAVGTGGILFSFKAGWEFGLAAYWIEIKP